MFYRADISKISFPHSLHAQGFFAPWILPCLVRSELDLKSFPHRHYKHGGFFFSIRFSLLSPMFQKKISELVLKSFPVNTFTGFLFTMLLHMLEKAWLLTAISFTLGMFPHPMKFLVLKENWALPEGLPTFLQSCEWISSQEWILRCQIKPTSMTKYYFIFIAFIGFLSTRVFWGINHEH